MTADAELYLGLMSGTSLDGVDVAAVALGGHDEEPRPARLLHFRSRPYDDLFRRRLARLLDVGTGEDLCELNFELGRRFGEATREALAEWDLDRARIGAVGSHGQTVWHSPPSDGARGATLQLGEAAVIAEMTGLPVVADFRVRDVAAGGHGAPLSPYFDDVLLRGKEPRAVQNLGGMGNVTLLPPAGSEETPVAFDTGPGVALLDAAASRLSGGELRFDRDGRMAAQGRVIPELLEEWLDDPFFRETPPRSTGRERFGPARVEEWLSRHEQRDPTDLMATLTELTARTVADSLEMAAAGVDEVVLCGGGARNPELVRRLTERVAPRRVRPLEALGWDGDAREAAAFALLARQYRLEIPVDVSWATGVGGARRLGKGVPA